MVYTASRGDHVCTKFILNKGKKNNVFKIRFRQKHVHVHCRCNNNNNMYTKYKVTNINGISIDIETNRNMARIII